MRRLFRFALVTALFASPVEAQITLGGEDQDSTLNYVDTLTSKKYDPSQPWVWQVLPLGNVLNDWYQIAACSHTPAPIQVFGQLRFYMVNSKGWGAGKSTVGLSILTTGQVFLSYAYANDNTLVMHELLHIQLYLLGYQGLDPHPKPYFDGHCGVWTHYPNDYVKPKT